MSKTGLSKTELIIHYCTYIVFSGGTAHIFRLWQADGGSILLACQFTFMMACSTAPLIAEPFISKMVNHQDLGSNQTSNGSSWNALYHTNESVTMVFNYDTDNFNQSVNQWNIAPDRVTASTSKTYLIESLDIVLYRGTVFPYSIVASLQITMCIYISVVYICTVRGTNTMVRYSGSEANQSKINIPLLICLVIFQSLSSGTELTFSLVIFLFVRDILSWSASDAAHVTTVYFMAVASGRALGVPVTKWLSPEAYIGICVLVTYCSATVLLIVGHPSPAWVWVITIIIGLSISMQYSGAFDLGKKHMDMRASTVGCLTFGRFLGGLLIPALVNYYLTKFILIVWLVGTLLFIVYVVILIIVKFPRNMYNKLQ